MEKKKRDVSLPKRFNSEDVKKWQEQANLTLAPVRCRLRTIRNGSGG